jgi:hypothetical protein
VQRRALRRSFAIAGAALAGCFYTEPINRQPKVLPPQRVCDAAHPADPCTPDNLHHGDHVMVKAAFDDPDGDVNAGTVQWRISACDGTTTNCDANRLYDDTLPALPPYPEFTVPPALSAGGVPVRNIVFELVVFDDRGASSTAEDSWNVIPDPPAVAQGRSAETGTP